MQKRRGERDLFSFEYNLLPNFYQILTTTWIGHKTDDYCSICSFYQTKLQSSVKIGIPTKNLGVLCPQNIHTVPLAPLLKYYCPRFFLRNVKTDTKMTRASALAKN